MIYGVINTPVLHDRYIIFILIPVLVLISCLISELKNKRFKLFLISFIFIITLSNHFIEIFKRVNTKPQFGLAVEIIKKSGNKNIILYVQKDTSYPVGNLVTNYVKNINIWAKNNLDFYQYEELNNELKLKLFTPLLVCLHNIPPTLYSTYTMNKTVIIKILIHVSADLLLILYQKQNKQN